VRETSKGQHGALARAILTGVLGIILLHFWPTVQGTRAPDWALGAFWVGAGLFVLGALDACQAFARALHRAVRTFRALRPPLPKNAAGWLSRKEALRAGLGGTKGLFFGIVDGLPIFIPDAAHTLLVAPARTGKTIGFVLSALCHDIGCSRIVADMKGELAVMTAALIQRLHGHRVIILNPAFKFRLGNARYNPLQLIIDAKDHAPEDAMGDARSLVLLLIPEPKGGDRDPFWPGGARSLLVFVIVALCVLKEAFEATLPRCYEVLNDETELEALLEEALSCDALAGEVAMLARRIMASRAKNEHHFGSFREQALQALFPFGPSGRLAASVERCDFRFRELKSELITQLQQLNA